MLVLHTRPNTLRVYIVYIDPIIGPNTLNKDVLGPLSRLICSIHLHGITSPVSHTPNLRSPMVRPKGVHDDVVMLGVCLGVVCIRYVIQVVSLLMWGVILRLYMVLL